MALRVISAAVGMPLVLVFLWAGLPWLSVLVVGIASVGLLEFYRLTEHWGAHPSFLIGVPWTLLFIVSGHMGGWMTPWLLLGGAATALTWHQLRRLARGPRAIMSNGVQQTFRDSLADWVYTAAGAMYMGWTLSLALVLRQESQGQEWVLLAILATVATDTGAFFVGRALGRRRLAPAISPGKTWEGAAGGFLIGAGVVVALTGLLDLPVSLWQGALLGVLVGVFAQLGDLLESRIKRAAGVKDSGVLLPGHGGMLDRLDSVVFVLVVVYYFFIWTVK